MPDVTIKSRDRNGRKPDLLMYIYVLCSYTQ